MIGEVNEYRSEKNFGTSKVNERGIKGERNSAKVQQNFNKINVNNWLRWGRFSRGYGLGFNPSMMTTKGQQDLTLAMARPLFL